MQRVERKPFVFTASDKHHRLGLRRQCFLDCIQVGCFGVVHVLDAIELAHKFAPVRARLVILNCGHHLRE
jgi:hypothetical protein